MFSSRRAVKAALASAAAAALVVVGVPGVSHADSKIINFPNFKNASALTLNGTAAIAVGTYAGKPAKVLRLTNGGAAQAGTAWSTKKIHPTKSFKTVIEVSAYQAVGAHADGTAFVLQSKGSNALGGNGGALGYGGIRPSVAIEFDTFRNSAFDVDANHVSVVTGGTPDTAVATAPTTVPLFGAPFRATLTYDAPTKILRVYLNTLDKSGGGTKVLLKKVDLPALLGHWPVYAGLTGGTGVGTSTQDILKWSLTV